MLTTLDHKPSVVQTLLQFTCPLAHISFFLICECSSIWWIFETIFSTFQIHSQYVFIVFNFLEKWKFSTMAKLDTTRLDMVLFHCKYLTSLRSRIATKFTQESEKQRLGKTKKIVWNLAKKNVPYLFKPSHLFRIKKVWSKTITWQTFVTLCGEIVCLKKTRRSCADILSVCFK